MNHLKNNTAIKYGLTRIAKLLLLFVALVSSASLFAQEKLIPVVKGTVRNTSEEVLSGATVFIPGTGKYATTKKKTERLN